MFSTAKRTGGVDALADRRVRVEQPPYELRWILFGKVLLRQPLHRGDEGIDVARRLQRIAIGGAFLRSELLLELGEILDLEVPLTPNAPPFRVQAKVVRAVRGNEVKSGPGMGIEFVSPSAAFREALSAFLSG